MATHVFPKGRCVAGDNCKYPNLWLRPQDKCYDCEEIIHPLCGILIEDGDAYRCPSCANATSNDKCETATKVTDCDSAPNKHEGFATKEIVVCSKVDNSSQISTITETKDKSNYTSIEKNYFVTSEQHINTDMKTQDGDIWITLRKAVLKEIDGDLKAMMILRSQEVGLKVKQGDEEKIVSSWNEIGQAWRNDDSIDTANKLYEIVHATFDDKSGYEIYMESQIMDRLQLQYKDEGYKKKGCIARMIITRKSELNKLINKRSESTHQKKISSKRTERNNSNRNSKGTFTIKGPNEDSCYNRDGSVCSVDTKGQIERFDNHFYMEKIRLLEQQKNVVRLFVIFLFP